MLRKLLQRLFKDPDSAIVMIRRLLTEQAAEHWRQYAIAFVFMAVSPLNADLVSAQPSRIHRLSV